MKTITTSIAGIALLMLTGSALAEEGGMNSLRVGGYWITYHSTADNLSGPLTPPGLNAKLDDSYTPYFAYVRTLSTHFNIELAGGIPPKVKTKASGPATVGSVPYNGQEILTAKWIAPTLLLNYVFFDESHALRPYIGIGVNHTIFVERRITPAGEAITGGPTRVSLSPSTGIAGTVGLSYHVKDAWNVYASYSMSKVTSDIEANTAGITRKSHISFGPRAFVLSVGYSFGR